MIVFLMHLRLLIFIIYPTACYIVIQLIFALLIIQPVNLYRNKGASTSFKFSVPLMCQGFFYTQWGKKGQSRICFSIPISLCVRFPAACLHVSHSTFIK